MPERLRRLAELSPRDWVLLAQLAALAWLAALAVRLASLPRLTARLDRWATHRWLARVPVPHAGTDVRRLAELADLAARAIGGERRCLPRSLVLYWLLRARGEPATLLLGVRRDAGGLSGHAWVETPGGAAGPGAEAPRGYATLARLGRP